MQGRDAIREIITEFVEYHQIECNNFCNLCEHIAATTPTYKPCWNDIDDDGDGKYDFTGQPPAGGTPEGADCAFPFSSISAPSSADVGSTYQASCTSNYGWQQRLGVNVVSGGGGSVYRGYTATEGYRADITAPTSCGTQTLQCGSDKAGVAIATPIRQTTVSIVASEPGTETSCSDGIDNDCDGSIDSGDSDCNTGCPAGTTKNLYASWDNWNGVPSLFLNDQSSTCCSETTHCAFDRSCRSLGYTNSGSTAICGRVGSNRTAAYDCKAGNFGSSFIGNTGGTTYYCCDDGDGDNDGVFQTTVCPNNCGDGTLDPGEQCDDGRDCSYDICNGQCPKTCSSDCTFNNCDSRQATYELNLRNGWNLISSPVFEAVPTEFTDFQTTCRYTSPLWRFNANTQQYEQADYVTGAREAFWIKVAGDCMTTITGDRTYTLSDFDGLNLKTGWNFIGGFPDGIIFDDIRETCIFEKNSYSYSPTKNNWENPIATEAGKGYIIEVVEDCHLIGVDRRTELVIFISPQYSQDQEIENAVRTYANAVRQDTGWDTEIIKISQSQNNFKKIDQLIEQIRPKAVIMVGEDTDTALSAEFDDVETPSVIPWMTFGGESSYHIATESDFDPDQNHPPLGKIIIYDRPYNTEVAVSLIYPVSTISFDRKKNQIIETFGKFSASAARTLTQFTG